MNDISFYIREHVMRATSEGEYCEHCNSRTGIGFYVFTQCELRFNEKGFQRYLDFRNLSKDINNKDLYVKRYSTDTFNRNQLINDFRIACNTELTQSIVDEQPFMDTNKL